MTRPDQVETFPYRPTRVVDSVADLVDMVAERARPVVTGLLATGA